MARVPCVTALALLAAFVPACQEDVQDPGGLSGGNGMSASAGTDTETDTAASSGSATAATSVGSDSASSGGGASGSSGSSGGASSTGGGSSSSTSTSTSTSSTSGGGTCGNGQIDPAEQCDGANLGGFDCTGLGYAGGTLSCDPVTCTFDTSMCMAGSGGTGG